MHIIKQQKQGSRLQWNLIETLNKIAESAVLFSQQNRDLLDLHIVVTDFILPAHPACWISNPARHIRKQMAIGGESGKMLAVWDIASNQVACYCSYYCLIFIIWFVIL